MKIIGHRGARGLAPENTITGLRKGLEHGVDELEIDLRVTKDDIVVLHHDAVLKDAGGGRFRISRHTYAELKDRKPDLPTLEEALDTIGHPVPFYIEVKHYERVRPVVKILRGYLKKGWRPEDFRLGSKHQKTLLELHKALPEIQKIVIERWSGVRGTRRARRLGTKRLSMNKNWLWWGFIRAMKRGGWELYAYPMNNAVRAKKWAGHGLAGVITDYPDRFK